MTARRFTDKPDLHPEAVKGLPLHHDAVVQRRTLFPSTVIEVTEDAPERLLVSGRNNRKLGEKIAKGKFAGYSIFQLSLEERATCNPKCEHLTYCYGNGMQMARRLRIGDPEVFYDRLSGELGDLLREHGKIMVRLHVLGDFPSIEYVEYWREMIDTFEGDLACYGYTRWRPDHPIGSVIEGVKETHPKHFRIRWSGLKGDDGSLVIDRQPESSVVPEGLVCPAQTDATASCSTCALCWDSTKNTIVFVKHGPTNQAVNNERTLAAVPQADETGLRRIDAIELSKRIVPAELPEQKPEGRYVPPGDLLIEDAYQRGLSTKSLTLIRKIVSEWSWTKFKPPICARLPDGRLVVIDGQHTAIAARTHGGIEKIPVMIMPAISLQQRAESFVAHNRDRVAMTPTQVFHAQLAAGDPDVNRAAQWALEVGGEVPRNPLPRQYAKRGHIIPVAELVALSKRRDKQTFQDIIAVCVLSGHAPIVRNLLRGVESLLTNTLFSDVRGEGLKKIAAALHSIENPDMACRVAAAKSGMKAPETLAQMIAKQVRIAKGVPGVA